MDPGRRGGYSWFDQPFRYQAQVRGGNLPPTQESAKQPTGRVGSKRRAERDERAKNGHFADEEIPMGCVVSDVSRHRTGRRRTGWSILQSVRLKNWHGKPGFRQRRKGCRTRSWDDEIARCSRSILKTRRQSRLVRAPGPRIEYDLVLVIGSREMIKAGSWSIGTGTRSWRTKYD